jgi:hypothetical protein
MSELKALPTTQKGKIDPYYFLALLPENHKGK